LLVDRHDDRHRVALRDLLHQSRRRTIRDVLDRVVPLRILLGAEIRAGYWLRAKPERFWLRLVAMRRSSPLAGSLQ
ncbi:MAG TPA: hypothetical protein VII02_00105, partial [Gemmatimonadaceae bacterium]